MNSVLPSIPGEIVTESRKYEIRKRIKELLGVVNFPGSHPVSFTSKNLKELEEENYWVCEKTDGVRVLAFMTMNANGKPEVYLIDRKNQYRYVPHLRFPVPTDDKNFQEIFSRYVREGLKFHKDTLIDCELVFDVEEDGTRKLKLLVFDTLFVLGKDLLKRPLSKRCGYMNDYIIKPYEKYINNPDVACLQPFTVEIKKMEFSYALTKVLKEIIPSLKHKSDGLVFTSENAPYTIGTCEKMLKWKPGNENSIDFKLKLVSSGEGKPKFNLLKWIKSDEYEYFGEMSVTDEEWDCFVRDGTKLDGRIAEVAYDPSDAQWRLIRFREDKSRPNHSSVVDRILESIKDGVTEEELIAHASKIRDTWNQRKNRERGRQQHRERQEQEEFHYKHRKPQQQADAQRNTQTSVASFSSMSPRTAPIQKQPSSRNAKNEQAKPLLQNKPPTTEGPESSLQKKSPKTQTSLQSPVQTPPEPFQLSPRSQQSAQSSPESLEARSHAKLQMHSSSQRSSPYPDPRLRSQGTPTQSRPSPPNHPASGAPQQPTPPHTDKPEPTVF